MAVARVCGLFGINLLDAVTHSATLITHSSEPLFPSLCICTFIDVPRPQSLTLIIMIVAYANYCPLANSMENKTTQTAPMVITMTVTISLANHTFPPRTACAAKHSRITLSFSAPTKPFVATPNRPEDIPNVLVSFFSIKPQRIMHGSGPS